MEQLSGWITRSQIGINAHPGILSANVWLRQSSCNLAIDLQQCSSRVRRDSTSASAPEPAVLHLQFCILRCILSGIACNYLAPLAASALARGQICLRRFWVHFIAFWGVSIECEVRYPHRESRAPLVFILGHHLCSANLRCFKHAPAINPVSERGHIRITLKIRSLAGSNSPSR